MKGLVKLMLIMIVVLFSCVDNNVIIERYPDGKTRLECELVDGLRSGECKGYFPDGQLEFISEYKSDTLNGKTRFYHPNGELHWISYFDNGVKKGTIDYYDSTGTLYQTSTFRENSLHGKSYVYGNGEITSEMNYFNGQLDGYYKEYNSNGSIIYKAKYSKGHTIWKEEYDSLGNIVSRQKGISYKYKLQGDTLSIYATLHGFNHDMMGFDPDSSMASLLITDNFYTNNNPLEIKLRINSTVEEVAFLGTLFEMDTLDGGKGIVKNVEVVDYLIDLSNK